jgi:sodium/hydrogen exchanger 8
MALFFQGIVLSHYNAYNLSPRAHVASEQIFSTFATLTETIVFVYMGMGVFTGGFQHWNLTFCLVAFLACLVGRALNIFPLSWLANLCRKGRRRSGGSGGTGDYKITPKMQMVLWFAGLRGAIAFALAENMPGPHKDVYATATLTICIVTTVVCGGFTERILTVFGMREEPTPKLRATPYKYDRANGVDDSEGSDQNLIGDDEDDEQDETMNSLTYKPPTPKRQESILSQPRRQLGETIKGVWNQFDDRVLKPHFGGEEDRHESSQSSASSTPDEVEGRDDRSNQSKIHHPYEDDGVRLDLALAGAITSVGRSRTPYTTPTRSGSRNTNSDFEMQTFGGTSSAADEHHLDDEETVWLTSKRVGYI